jgi:hypothetical protein
MQAKDAAPERRNATRRRADEGTAVCFERYLKSGSGPRVRETALRAVGHFGLSTSYHAKCALTSNRCQLGST